jgi:putative chitinase
MTVEVSLLQILQLAPNARSSYRNAIANGQPVLDAYGISETPLRVAHWLDRIGHTTPSLDLCGPSLASRGYLCEPRIVDVPA